MTGLRHTAFGQPLLDTLDAAIAEAKGQDPLAPVTVISPSNVAGLSLRRGLARTAAGGLLNVRFMVFARLAELIGAPAVAGVRGRPLTPLTRAEAVRRVLQEEDGPLRPVASHAETERAVDSAFRVLALAPDEALRALATHGSRAANLVSLFARFRTLTAGRYDEADLFQAAAGAIPSAPAVLRDVGHVVLVQARPYNRHEALLADALVAAGRAGRVVALTGSPDADRPLAAQPEVRPLPAEGSRILTAPDAGVEVRVVVRHIADAIRNGTPAHRAGVFYRMADLYEPILRDHFDAAGLPFNGPVAATLASTAAGRVLRGLLRLGSSDLRREDVMDWLTASPISDGNRLAPSRLWDQLAREAGIVRGLDQWLDRLDRFARAEAEAADDAEKEERRARAARARRAATESRRLATFVSKLSNDLRLPPGASWTERANLAARLLRAYLELSQVPDPEHEAHESLLHGLDELGSLDQLGGAVDDATFLRAVERLLESPATRHGSFGAGVFAGPISSAPGLDFDVVFILGMVEGQLPPGLDDDPLLPDRDRRDLAPHVPLAADRRANERRDFVAALHSAPHRVLAFPAADLQGQRKNLPSRWLLEMASLLAGELIDTESFAKHPSCAWLERYASFRATVESADVAASSQDYDLRSLAHAPLPDRHYLAGQAAFLAGGLEAQRARAGRGFSRWDGHVPGAPLPGITSPTRLETWAKCPFSYFLEYVLRVEGREDPEDILKLSAIDRGNIIHNALEAFFNESADRTAPGQRWGDTHRERLLSIANRLCDDVERAGRAGKPALWSVERERIRADLEAFMELDNERRADAGFQAAEFAFGRDDDPHPAVAVQLPGGGIMRFRGRIDRVDLAANGGKATVYDYKTGSDYGFRELEKDPLAAGKHLQLAIYAEAVRPAFDVREVDSYYWFVNSAVKKRIQGGEAGDSTRERLEATLEGIAAGLEQGVFPANPGAFHNGSHENCKFCPYDAICPGDRGRVWERKRDDPSLLPYLSLGGADDDV